MSKTWCHCSGQNLDKKHITVTSSKYFLMVSNWHQNDVTVLPGCQFISWRIPRRQMSCHVLLFELSSVFPSLREKSDWIFHEISVQEAREKSWTWEFIINFRRGVVIELGFLNNDEGLLQGYTLPGPSLPMSIMDTVSGVHENLGPSVWRIKRKKWINGGNFMFFINVKNINSR